MVKILDKEQNEWMRALPGVVWSYNSTRQASTKFSPFYLLHGFEPRTITDLVFRDDKNNEHIEDRIDEDFEEKDFQIRVSSLKRFQSEVFPEVEINIKQAQKRQKRDYENRHMGKKVF